MAKSSNNYISLISFAKQLETKGMFSPLWIFTLLIIIVFGFVALFTQLIKGHLVTGMRDNVVWGIYISNFIFLMGVSYAGAIFSGLLVLFNVSWRASILRLTQLISIISGLIGPLYILLCIGRLDRIYFLLIHGRIPSPIFWDMITIITYLIGNITFFFLLLVPDLAYLRDSSELRISNWRRKIYTALSINYKDTDKQQKDLRTAVKILAAMLIPMAVILSTILSWIFGMTLRPGWNSTIFGPYFVFASLYSGLAVLVIVMWIFRKSYNIKEFITIEHFNYTAIGLIVLGFIYGYYSFNEYFSLWYSFQKWDVKLIQKIFDFKLYGWHFVFTTYIGILLPTILIGFKRFKNVTSMGISAILILIGLWLKRFLIVIPTLETPLIPIQDIRPEYVNYRATWVEWSLTISGIALFLLIFTIITKIVPIVHLTIHVMDKPKSELKGIE